VAPVATVVTPEMVAASSASGFPLSFWVTAMFPLVSVATSATGPVRLPVEISTVWPVPDWVAKSFAPPTSPVAVTLAGLSDCPLVMAIVPESAGSCHSQLFAELVHAGSIKAP